MGSWPLLSIARMAGVIAIDGRDTYDIDLRGLLPASGLLAIDALHEQRAQQLFIRTMGWHSATTRGP